MANTLEWSSWSDKADAIRDWIASRARDGIVTTRNDVGAYVKERWSYTGDDMCDILFRVATETTD